MPKVPLIVDECEFPEASALYRDFVNGAYFHDSYRVSLTRKTCSVIDIFFAIFAHRPMWMKAVMVARNRLASLFAIEAPSTAEIMNRKSKPATPWGTRSARGQFSSSVAMNSLPGVTTRI